MKLIKLIIYLYLNDLSKGKLKMNITDTILDKI